MHPVQGAGRAGDSPIGPILARVPQDRAPRGNAPAGRAGAGWVAGAVCVVAADQAVKAVLVRALPEGSAVPLVPGLISLTHVRNPGIAFGLWPAIPPAVAAALALTLFAALFYNRGRWPRSRVDGAGLALMAGGAVGNLLDRLRLGCVIDYIDLHVWPVFNLADAAIVAGAGLLVIALAVEARPAQSRR